MQINKIRPVVYVSGPFSTHGNPEENVKIATEYANKLRDLGFAVISPHNNSGVIPTDMTWELWMEEDYSLVLMSHALFMLPNWEQSKGASIEHRWAKELGIPIFYAIENIDIITSHFFGPHSIWEKCPKQVHGFLKTVSNMFRVHLRKNQDYSPYNVLCTGEIGLMTRVWDKVSRLMSLQGFDIMTGKLNPKREPNNESIDDTILDLGVYSIIWQLVRKESWGK